MNTLGSLQIGCPPRGCEWFAGIMAICPPNCMMTVGDLARDLRQVCPGVAVPSDNDDDCCDWSLQWRVGKGKR